MRKVGLDPSFRRRFPAPVLGRPARAHRHRARAGGQAGVPGVRRSGRRARRLDPGAGAQSVHAAARRLQPHLSFHQPRSGRGRASVRPRRDHVPGPHRRNRADARVVQPRQPPYTQALLAEVPTLDRRRRDFAPIKGEIPSPIDPPPGCHFHPRCPHAMERCRSEKPRLREIAPGHWSACHLNDKGGAAGGGSGARSPP